MTNQQEADLLLRGWQSMRGLPPDERLERLMSEFFAPVPPCDVEYEANLRTVREIMGEMA